MKKHGIIMTENKRFIPIRHYNNQGICDNGVQDNLTKNTITSVIEASDLLNQLWEQVLRFEGYSQEHLARANMYEERIDYLKNIIQNNLPKEFADTVIEEMRKIK